MKYIEIECFEVYSSYDRDIRHVAFFSTETLAKEYIATKKGNYLSYNKVKKNFTIFESLEDAETFSKEEIKKKALEKLTPQEREVLGV